MEHERSAATGCLGAGAIFIAAVVVGFLVLWWLIAPGGPLHDAAGRYLGRHAADAAP